MLKMKYSTPAAGQLLELDHDLVLGPHVEGAGLHPFDAAQQFEGPSRLLGGVGDHERGQAADGDRRRVAPDGLAVLVQDGHLVTDGGRVTEDVAVVGVLRHQAQRALLSAPADEDGRPARLDGAGEVPGLVHRVVLAVEGDDLVAEHGPADLHRLLEPVEALAGGGELDPETLVLDVVPGRPDPEHGPPRADDVEGGDDLGQQRRVAVGDPGHHGAQPDAAGARRQATEQRVGLQHGLGGAAQGGELVEVVHHPQRLEARRLGGHGLLGHGLEELVVGHAEGEVGDLESDSHDPIMLLSGYRHPMGHPGPQRATRYGKRRRTHQTQPAPRATARATKIAASDHCSGQ